MNVPFDARVPFRLGVLDFCHNVGDTIKLAREADQLGYAQYWLTEHPPQPSPQVLLGVLGGVTSQIRVGTAGLLMHFRNPLQTAMDFQLLEAMYPGRVDLGFCGGKAEDLVAEALLLGAPDPRTSPVLFTERCLDLVRFARQDFPSDHRFQAIIAAEQVDGCPEIWGLGASVHTAVLAGENGLAFGYSLFHKSSQDDTAGVDAYRETFRPNPFRSEPLVSVAVAGSCAETEAAARKRRHLENPSIVPTVIGSPQQCREQLEAIAYRYTADVIVFLDVDSLFEDRVETYTLLAEACRIVETDATATEAVTRQTKRG